MRKARWLPCSDEWCVVYARSQKRLLKVRRPFQPDLQTQTADLSLAYQLGACGDGHAHLRNEYARSVPVSTPLIEPDDSSTGPIGVRPDMKDNDAQAV